jgi:hypothetical protein
MKALVDLRTGWIMATRLANFETEYAWMKRLFVTRHRLWPEPEELPGSWAPDL